jgi:hypothetical protein
MTFQLLRSLLKIFKDCPANSVFIDDFRKEFIEGRLSKAIYADLKKPKQSNKQVTSTNTIDLKGFCKGSTTLPRILNWMIHDSKLAILGAGSSNKASRAMDGFEVFQQLFNTNGNWLSCIADQISQINQKINKPQDDQKTNLCLFLKRVVVKRLTSDSFEFVLKGDSNIHTHLNYTETDFQSKGVAQLRAILNK